MFRLFQKEEEDVEGDSSTIIFKPGDIVQSTKGGITIQYMLLSIYYLPGTAWFLTDVDVQ